MRISKDLREFIALLNSNAVEYLVVGAFAVAWHGYPRSGEQNATRLLAALGQFGFGSLDLNRETFAADGVAVQLGVQPNRIDLLTSISGVSFEEAWAARECGALDGVEVAFI